MPGEEAEFDAMVDSYDEELRRRVAISGETPDFFAAERVRFLHGCLRALGLPSRTVLDFGCGMGATVPHLARSFAAEMVVGADESRESIKRASEDHGSIGRFLLLDDLPATPAFDVIYCNGVFHHIQPSRRLEALAYVRARLRPGGIFAVWENNPWNPVMTITMNRSFIDRNAVKVPSPEARRLAREAGFEVLRTDFLFYFPRVLAPLRGLEPLLRKLPLGAQYQMLCRNPG
jgi:SAM-dependent methyltransferase